MLTENNELKDVGQAIATQHTAMSAEPILSETALYPSRPMSGGGLFALLTNSLSNAFSSIWEPIKITTLRKTLPETPQSELIKSLPPVPPPRP